MIPLRLRLEVRRDPLPTEQCSTYFPVTKPLCLQGQEGETHLSHTTPICKSLGHSDRFWGYKGKGVVVQQMNGKNWMNELKEKPKRHTNTNYRPDLEILVPNHVNGVRKSWADGVMDQWRSKMIKPLVEDHHKRNTHMKC